MSDTKHWPTVKELIQGRIDRQAALQAKEALLQADKQQTGTLPVQQGDNNMAETNQPTTETRASAMMDKLRGAQSSAQVIEAMKEAEIKSSSEPVSNGQVESGEPVNKVEPKEFVMTHSHMGSTDSFIVNMPLVDLIRYAGFEYSLYQTDDGKAMTPSSKALKEKSFLERFQRQLDSDRVRDIANYMNSPLHYFPPIVCVPSHPTLHDRLVDIAKQVSANDNGNFIANVVLDAGSILAIDGQHRLAGIGRAIGPIATTMRRGLEMELEKLENSPLFKADGETQESRDRKIKLVHRQLDEHDHKIATLRSESMPVVIVAISPDDLATRQQLFSDINKTPRKVSKAISVLYDHVDTATALAKYSSGLPTNQYGEGMVGIAELVNYEGITPKAGESKVATLTNITSMVQPEAGLNSLVKAVEASVMTYEQVGKLIETVIYNLPRIREITQGLKYSEVSGKNTQYVCYSSVFFKAMGRVVDYLVSEQNRSQDSERDYDAVIKTVESLMVHLGETDGWSVDDELWTNATVNGKPVAVVNSAGKVDNKITTVRNMTTILIDTINKIRGVTSEIEQ